MTARGGIARRVLAIGLVAAAVYFISRTLVTQSDQLRDFQWRVDVPLLLASLGAHVGVLAWGVFVWSRVVRAFGILDAPYGVLLRIWALSNAARYVPGVVWQFVTAAELSSNAGLSRVVVLSSMLVHVLLSLVSAALVALATLPLEGLGVSEGASLGIRVAVVVGAAASVHPRLINACLRLVPRALGRDVLSWNAGWLRGASILALAVVSWVAYGAAYFLFVTALAPLPIRALGAAMGVNALSFIAGYLAVPVPGGLGVRESAMTLLLAPLLPTAVAAVIAIAARVWSIAAELALAGLGMLTTRLRPSETVPPPLG